MRLRIPSRSDWKVTPVPHSLTESPLERDLRGNSEKMREGEQRGVEQIKTGETERRLGRMRTG